MKNTITTDFLTENELALILSKADERTYKVKNIYKNGRLSGTETVPDYRNTAILHLLAYTGIRGEELASAIMNDVTISEQRGTLRVRGKNDAERELHLPYKVRYRLKRYFEQRFLLDNWYDASEDVKRRVENEPLFLSNKRGHLTNRHIRRIVDGIGEAAGFTNEKQSLYPHMFRQAYAHSLVNKKGISLETAQHILGHDHIESTKRYVKRSDEHD